MKANHITFPLLAICSAVLLSLGYIIPHCGFLMLFGFVPLLWMDRIADIQGRRHFWAWHYGTFLLWNAITTFWVCNATIGGGIFAMCGNAFQMSVIWALFRLVKRRFDGCRPYVFLATLWIAWERFYFDAEISWPWLVLGNGFANTTALIQWYDTTGLLGGSLWIWACNLCVFGLSCILADGSWQKFNNKARTAVIAATAIIFIAPVTVSLAKYYTYKPQEVCGELDCCLLQPNFDPYQKFQSMTQQEQDGVLTDMIHQYNAAKGNGPVLFIAPETFTSSVTLGEENSNRSILSYKQALMSCPDANLLFGASAYRFFFQSRRPSDTARDLGSNRWYESYNVAMMTDATERTETYIKSKLVVGVEKMPWPKVLGKVDDMLGGVMGRCVGQKEVSLLNYRNTGGLNIPLGCAVCYESVYPEHFASYVAKGALAMTVITNDAWWGDTPGYRQHLSYSRLRAIETRRDIARCANTGLSAFINSRGDVVSCTRWWQRQSLEGCVSLSRHITPFVKYGDITGRLCTFVFLLMFFAWGVNLITRPGNPKKK